MPLAILTIRKELHGFLFLCIRVVPFSINMGLRLAAQRSSAINKGRWGKIIKDYTGCDFRMQRLVILTGWSNLWDFLIRRSMGVPPEQKAAVIAMR